MAENIPNLPGGAVPPRPETSKIQPKKETVRINLPPKPSAAPTIKLPTLPPGGPAVAAPAPLPPPPTAGARAAAPAAPPTSQRPVSQQRPAAQAQRQVAVPRTSGLDTGLAIAAAVVALLAVGVTAYFVWGGLFAWPPPA